MRKDCENWENFTFTTTFRLLSSSLSPPAAVCCIAILPSPLFHKNVQMPVLNSSPYELIKNGLLSLYVTRQSLNIPDSLMNLCNVEQLTLPLITCRVVVPVGHNSHPCCLQGKRDTLIHFLLHHIVFVCVFRYVCVIMKCDFDERSLQRVGKAL